MTDNHDVLQSMGSQIVGHNSVTELKVAVISKSAVEELGKQCMVQASPTQPFPSSGVRMKQRFKNYIVSESFFLAHLLRNLNQSF